MNRQGLVTRVLHDKLVEILITLPSSDFKDEDLEDDNDLEDQYQKCRTEGGDIRTSGLGTKVHEKQDNKDQGAQCKKDQVQEDEVGRAQGNHVTKVIDKINKYFSD
ncbi:hypothetical protein NDU88_001049 [Pleurodeles waltl]|uniref:Uncharacterized protein n=1 Tax=Pleurodeles waltl TaxID=8319 RepID=A0AAV7NEL1_PLEWA|nr:hypothetical protein NDU88_001049 [Pleurodeles waltl]